MWGDGWMYARESIGTVQISVASRHKSARLIPSRFLSRVTPVQPFGNAAFARSTAIHHHALPFLTHSTHSTQTSSVCLVIFIIRYSTPTSVLIPFIEFFRWSRSKKSPSLTRRTTLCALSLSSSFLWPSLASRLLSRRMHPLRLTLT